MARVVELETPLGSRSSGYLVDILGATDSVEGFEQERTWARDCWTALAPHHAGVYVNWLMEGESGGYARRMARSATTVSMP